ncbi:hypothetical protein WDV06_13000 [Streptomyces racemochromogenes]|uniref:Uncharacterized protein n=1 Tax=Streptomyces racemochromogenes TaxID=67353 RepID=A0ABW7PCB0_9ACTN
MSDRHDGNRSRDQDRQQDQGQARGQRGRGRAPGPGQPRTGGRPRSPGEVAHERGREDATLRDVMRDLDEEDLYDMRDDR